jgi:uncharacterized protein
LRILVDMGHPAHVHFYRNAIRILEIRGHDVVVTASDKDVTVSLLRAFRIPFVLRGRHSATVAGKAIQMLPTTFRIANVAVRERVDVLTGINNPYIAQAGRVLGIPSAIFDDTETASLINLATFAFATIVCTPRRFSRDLGPKQFRYDGFHELAYLHPSYFTPDSKVPLRLSPDGRPYVVVRLVAWSASHDSVRNRGRLTDFLVRGGIERLSRFGRVFIVGEGPLPEALKANRYPLPPETVLDALAGSSAYFGEGATMATEAALLGRPSLYVAPFRFGSMAELETRFGLLRSITDPSEALAQLGSWLTEPAIDRVWAERRQKMLSETVDVTAMLVELFTRGPDAFMSVHRKPLKQPEVGM